MVPARSGPGESLSAEGPPLAVAERGKEQALWGLFL